MNWEAIGGICAIIGVFYYFYQFHYLPKAELREAKINLLAHYSTSQRLIDKLMEDIKDYAQKYNYYNEFFSQGVTFGSYITYLENMRSVELSQEMYDRLSLSTDFSKDNISSLRNNLEKQILSFNNSQAYFDTVFKYNINRSYL